MHQLCDMLNAQGADASLKYVEEIEGALMPSQTSECFYVDKYSNLSICKEDIVSQDAVIVIPEVWGHYAISLAASNPVLIWWLAVDFGLLALGRSRRHLDHLRSNPRIFHAYQSEYARQFLSALGLRTHDLPLSDYVNIHWKNTEATSGMQRSDKLHICYNPLKGGWLAQAFIKNHPEVTATPLIDMSEAEILQAFRSTDAYVEFGCLPGKDRLPREAITAGTAVFLRKSGDGAYPSDWSFPEASYFDTADCFNGELINRIRSICKTEDPRQYLAKAREKVASEKDVFQMEVNGLIKFFQDHRTLTGVEQEIHKYLREAHYFVDELTYAEKELRAITKSTSWRITAPLRKARVFMGKCRSVVTQALKRTHRS